MKKIILALVAFLYSFYGYSQFPEGFEGSATTLPANWSEYHSGSGGSQIWKVSTIPNFVYEGSKGVTVDREQIGLGNSEQDYLVTPAITVVANQQLKFWTKQFSFGNQGATFEIQISTNADASVLSSYTVLQTWTEEELNAVYNVWEEKVVNIPASYLGQVVHLAFVRKVTQEGVAPSGDRWIVDKVNVVQKCLEPTEVTSSNQDVTTMSLNWKDIPGDAWDVAYFPQGTTTFDGTPTLSNITLANTPNLAEETANNYELDLTNLTPDTIYEYWVRTSCSTDNKSIWVGPKIFITLPYGSTCNGAIQVASLPYQTSANTGNYSDLVDVAQGTGCGATPAGTNYMDGNEVFYTYTPTTSGMISVKLTPTGPNSSVFIYQGCPVGGNCLGGAASTNSNVRFIDNFAVTANTPYTIVVSSSAATQTVGYTLVIQQENCDPPVGQATTGLTLHEATLNWTNPTVSTSWEVSIQDLGAGIPQGVGVTVTGGLPTYHATDLIEGHQYQYWVRAECSPGIFSAWAGPYPFNTVICEDVNKCNYTFRMTDSANNGWQGAKMQVRQNNIVIAEIGPTYTTGAGPVDVVVGLCHNVPFDLYWSVAGSASQQCKVAVINSFGQTLFTKAAGVSGVGQVVYSNVVDCLIPECDIAPINVALSTITTTGANVSWVAPATTSWDICVLPAGSPAPTLTTPDENTTLPPIFYNNIVANGTNPNFNFDISGLLADTPYDVYVRVNCAPSPSPWSTVTTVTTLPTCPKPTGLSVPSATITTTSAQFVWANGSPTDTKWEILLVPSDTATLPTVLPPATPTFSGQITQIVEAPQGSPFQINGLDPAQIYFYYIRSICSDDNISTWAGPIYFNTVTCEPTTKCNYKFLLTNTSGNSWNGGRMQVLQNGILIQTLGAGLVNNPNGVSIPLCPDVSIQLFWSVAGTISENIGITIISPFNDIIYTKPAGTGTPLTMLYNQLGNCTPPSCPKPLSLAVDPLTIGTTTAQLSWTEQSTATQWEVFVTPFGSAPPVNYTPLHATSSTPFSGDGGFYYLTDTPVPFTVTGLASGTSYQYYVRAICSSTDISTWTILNPIKFITKPINDECLGAIVVPVNPDRNCVQFAVGNTLGATRSLPNTAPVCPGNTDDDVWYTFQATSTIHIIKINNIVGTTTDLNHTLYSGNDCGALTQLYCSNPDTSVAVNLIPGNFYKIRVYTNGGNINQTASFELCITTPPPVTNDNCITATPAPVNNGLICTLTTPGSLTGATASNQGVASCSGTEDDDVWFSFVSNSATQVIDLLNIQGTATDLNHAVYSGSCNNLTLKYCSDPDESMNTSFVVGQTYYIRVWSASSTLQDITFDLCIGRILPPITTSTTQYTKQQLIEDILLNTTCANVSNITFSTGTNFTGITANGIGYFNKGESEFPFEDGIILSTGNANNAPGPNDSILSDGNDDFAFPPTWIGDDDLEAIIPIQSQNATKLEFDFTPLANQISFNYLFAAEEYGTFQCSPQFADAFAFILTDLTTGISTNLAVIPNTTIPVSVVNIRDEAYNAGCDSQNQEYFGGFFGVNGINPLGAPINFNGFTVPLTAFSPVTAGNPYHIKLVIADGQDTQFDSAVFLQGDSFSIGNIELGSDFLEASGNAICPGDSVTIDSGLNPSVYNFTWYHGTDIIPNETGSSLTVTDEGVYSVHAQYGLSSCVQTDSVTVEFFQDAIAGTAQNLIDCNPTGLSVFDLTENEASIMNPFVAGTHTINYFTSFNDADTNNLANAITSPTTFANTSTPQTIYVRVSKIGTTCYQIVQFTLTVQDLTPQFTFSGDTTICPQETTTISVVPTDNNFDISLVTYQWQYLGVDIAGEINNSITISGANYGMYSCTVNNTGCEATQNVEITNSNTVWDLVVSGSDKLCPDEIGTITSSVTNIPSNVTATYTYTLPNGTVSSDTDDSLSISDEGIYTIMVNILGCTSTTEFTVLSNDEEFEIEPQSGCNTGNYVIKVLPKNNSFDISTSTFQWTDPKGTIISIESSCNATIPGEYTCIITDVYGCSTTFSQQFSSINCEIQQGISPKGVGPGDNKNDSFDLSTLNVSKLEIFNRYGSKVYTKDNYTNEWYGQSDAGNELPDGTYYYVIEIVNDDPKTGWIYINREQ